MSNRANEISIRCKLSGLPLGQFIMADSRIAGPGKFAYTKTWKEQLHYHPIFSLSTSELLEKQLYVRFYRKDFSEQDKQLLFMALAYSTGAVIVAEGSAGLPSYKTALRFWNPLTDIVKWYNYLNSKLFKFPRLRISKENSWDIGIRNWINACHEARNEWERKANKLERRERSKIATRIVEHQIKSLHLGIELNLEALFDWATAEQSEHILNKKSWGTLPNSKTKKNYPTGAFMWILTGRQSETVYYPQTQENSYKKFFCCTDEELTNYSLADVNALEEFLIDEKVMEVGNVISHHVSKRIAYLKQKLKQDHDIFELLDGPEKAESIELLAKLSEGAPTEEPKREQFKSALDYQLAAAKWRLANRKVA